MIAIWVPRIALSASDEPQIAIMGRGLGASI
jgi:hypothetical protein